MKRQERAGQRLCSIAQSPSRLAPGGSRVCGYSVYIYEEAGEGRAVPVQHRAEPKPTSAWRLESMWL